MASQKDVVKAQNAAAQAQAQARNEQQALDYFNAMDNFYLRQYQDVQNKTLTDKIQKDQFKEALTISDMKKDAQLRAFDLSEERYRDQLEINQAEFERAQGNLDSQFDSTLRSYEDQIGDQERAFEREEARAAFDERSITRQRDQAISQFDTQTRRDDLSITRARDQLNQRQSFRDAAQARQSGLLQQDRADIDTQTREIQNIRVQSDLIRQNREAAVDLEEARALLNRDSQLSNIAFQKQGQRIETLARVGQSKARGRKGRSADRSLQTTLALSGINIARLTNQAFYVQEEFSGTQAAVANRKAAIGFEDEISKIRETSALEQLGTRGQRLTTQDTYETATRAAEAKGDLTEQERLDTQRTLLADIGKSQLDFATGETDQQLEQIAYAMGVSKEQLTMNKERLGASLVSAVATLDDQLLALDQARYKADYNAHAARMLPPEFAPDAKAPYDVPLPKYIEPRPGAAPAPAYQAQYIPPPTQSGLGQALMIGGAALSVAAIPFTAGASAAIAGGAAGTAGLGSALGLSSTLGGLTVGGAMATGTALGGLGTGLSTFGGSDMFRY